MNMQRAEDGRLETLVVQSIDQHKEMIGLLGQLNQQLVTLSTHVIEQFNASFEALQRKVQQTDQLLTTQLSLADVTDTVSRLLAKRKLLQEESAQLLRDALPGARNARSLLASEMQSLKAGRRALSGYRNGPSRQGTIINRRR